VSAEETIAMLRGGADGIVARRAARVSWAKAATFRWADAMKEMDRRCGEAAETLDEEAFERLLDEEQAKVDAIRAEIDAVIHHDKWPRELYFGCI
jgi:hypothetical protein